jgi:chromosomal replication initiator protein
MQDTKQLWEQCLGDIEQAVSRANYSTWFKNTTITRQENGTACIGVPNEFVKDWLCNKYHKLILKTLMQYSENVRAVEYTITRYDIKPKEEVSIEQKSFINKELPLQDLYINKEDNLNPRYIFESFIVGSFNELAFAAAPSYC